MPFARKLSAILIFLEPGHRLKELHEGKRHLGRALLDRSEPLQQLLRSLVHDNLP